MKKKVLVIDDQKLICDITERWLSNNGYEVLRAYDGKTGYNVIENEKPDLVLIDILLPGISGIELCEKIRQVEDLRYIPLVLMSAVYKDRDLLNQIKNIADDFIEKPFKENKLISKVNQYLQPVTTTQSQKNEKEIEVDYVENSIDKITNEEESSSPAFSQKEADLVNKDQPVNEIKSPSPDKTVQLEMDKVLDFEYTDPGLLDEEPPAKPPPGTANDDEVVMLNLSPINKEPESTSENSSNESKDKDKKKKNNTDRFVDQELEDLFKIIKDK